MCCAIRFLKLIRGFLHKLDSFDSINLIAFVLGLGFLKTQFEGVFLELEESSKKYGTFYACYDDQKHKNTYSKFFTFFSRIGYPRLTCNLNFYLEVPPPSDF